MTKRYDALKPVSANGTDDINWHFRYPVPLCRDWFLPLHFYKYVPTLGPYTWDSLGNEKTTFYDFLPEERLSTSLNKSPTHSDAISFKFKLDSLGVITNSNPKDCVDLMKWPKSQSTFQKEISKKLSFFGSLILKPQVLFSVQCIIFHKYFNNLYRLSSFIFRQ